jgi:hypothetical protein
VDTRPTRRHPEHRAPPRAREQRYRNTARRDSAAISDNPAEMHQQSRPCSHYVLFVALRAAPRLVSPRSSAICSGNNNSNCQPRCRSRPPGAGALARSRLLAEPRRMQEGLAHVRHPPVTLWAPSPPLGNDFAGTPQRCSDPGDMTTAQSATVSGLSRSTSAGGAYQPARCGNERAGCRSKSHRTGRPSAGARDGTGKDGPAEHGTAGALVPGLDDLERPEQPQK